MSMADQFRAFLAAKEPQIIDGALKSQEANAKEFAREVRRKVPVGSGDLKKSIKITGPGERTPAYSRGGAKVVAPNAFMVTAGDTKTRYGHIVEHGSKKILARPFWWVVYKLLKTKFRRRQKAALRKAVK